MFNELPPILSGDATKQLRDMRSYLVRMSQALTDMAQSDSITAAVKEAVANAQGNGQKVEQEINSRVSQLRSLILKTADDVKAYADQITTSLKSSYVAKSDFGAYTENISTIIEQTARATVESFKYEEAIEALRDDLLTQEAYITNIAGEIRRGFIDVAGERYFGIAISDKLNFTGTIVEESGISYYELVPGQSMGLYTAHGWYFFMNGIKLGWFDSEDGMLHVGNIVVEDTLQMGDWLITHLGGWGIRYVGGE